MDYWKWQIRRVRISKIRQPGEERMRRIIYGMIVTALYTFVEYLMITRVDSLSLQLLPIIVLGFSLSCLWHIGFISGLGRDANCVLDESGGKN